jgi:hypothetical protein
MEEKPNIIEAGTEAIPISEDVKLIFEQVIKGNLEEVKEGRKLEDGQGLYLWEKIIPGEDGDTEYAYMRKGEYPEGQASETAIHVTFYNREGIPAGGHSVAKYINGKWNLTP